MIASVMRPPASRQNVGGAQGQMVVNPAAFNQLARLHRWEVGARTHVASLRGDFLALPPVGYHYGVQIEHDTTATTVAVPAGRFNGGFFNGNTPRFLAPLGLMQNVAYALNTSSPIYSTSGWANYVINLYSNRGYDPMRHTNIVDNVGRSEKQFTHFGIFRTGPPTTIIAPDALIPAGAVAYTMRASYRIPLTLGDFATAGLLPVQDIGIQPQIQFNFGARTDIMTVAADFTAEPTGLARVYVDWFTLPTVTVQPNTEYILQTREEQISVPAVAQTIHRPQIGGILLRNILCCFGTQGTHLRAVSAQTKAPLSLRVQQAETLENLNTWVKIADELRTTSKLQPDEAFAFDHTLGFGDPTLPSLRDRLPTFMLTLVEYLIDWPTNANWGLPGEVRPIWQQLVRLDRVR